MTTKQVRSVHVQTTINGQDMEFLVPPYMSLLDALREVVGLTGTKEGCNDGNCGACTVNMDGRIVDSCLVLGAEVEGKSVDTIEGMATPDGLHPLQQAFPGRGCPSVWNMHPRFPRSGQGSARQRAEAERRAHTSLAGRESVQVHRLRQDSSRS